MPTRATVILKEITAGDRRHVDELASICYPELREIARKTLSGGRDRMITRPTEGVHETFLRVINQTEISFEDRAHFLAINAKIKVKLGDREARDAAIRALCEHSGAELLQRVGNVGLLFKKKRKNSRFDTL